MIKVLLPEVDLGDPLFYGENVSWSFGGGGSLTWWT